MEKPPFLQANEGWGIEGDAVLHQFIQKQPVIFGQHGLGFIMIMQEDKVPLVFAIQHRTAFRVLIPGFCPDIFRRKFRFF